MNRAHVLFFLVSFAVVTNLSLGAEYLLRLKITSPDAAAAFTAEHGGVLELVSEPGALYRWSSIERIDLPRFSDRNVHFIQKNHRIRLLANPSLQSQQAQLAALQSYIPVTDEPAYPDNPEIQTPAIQANGTDPLVAKSWGLATVGASNAWLNTPQGKEIVVAVTDTGVDYNHPDLLTNIWRNKGEIAGDGIDNDGNGYVDDLVGYDFYSNDSKPYDLSMTIADILFKGGNPGHGTHVAGVVGARLNNAQGTAGVGPQVRIMALRFIGEYGQGDTAGAVKAVDYAVANGALVINASWGSEGEEQGDEALREAIQRAEQKGVIFVAAAGNGRVSGTAAVGYNNDTDAKPMYPATYPYANIVAVAAVDSADKLAGFSNFGEKSVDLGAPGVKILSTVPGNRYQDLIIDLFGTKVTWDGTSMASPFVAGALAVAWSIDRNQTGSEVIKRILSQVQASPHLSGKVATGGRLSVKSLR